MPTLTTERLVLRAPSPRDVDPFVDFYQTERAQFVGGPKTEREAWNFFCTEIGHWAVRGYGMFTVTRKGEDTPLGIVGQWFPRGWPETEIGWVLFDETVEGTGVAFEASRACIDHAWTALGWTEMVSYIDHGNDRSVALAERLGAYLDEDAQAPAKEQGIWVYRHPRPEVAA